MLKVGLTGGIGSGKSTVARLLMALGYPVYLADDEAKEILNNDANVRRKIIDLLGPQSYNTSGYNRKYVAGLVFNDKNLLQQLNTIVHPVVEAHFLNWCNLRLDNEVVFQEAAILFENGSYRRFDKTILVTAPIAIRISRVMQRDNLPEQDVMSRIKNQWPDSEKIMLADFVVKCDGNHLVIPQVNDIIKRLEWEY